MSSSDRARLDAKLTAIQRDRGQQMALLTVATLNGDDIDDIAVRTFEKWQIGTKSKDNGVLVVVAAQDHKVRIEVGYGLEGVITDALAGRIIRTIMAPAFRDGDYYSGLDRGFDALVSAAAGEAAPDDAHQINRRLVPRAWMFWLAIWLGFSLLRAFGRRRRFGYWGTGAIIGDILGSGIGRGGWGGGGGGGGFSGGGGGRSGGGGASGSW